MHRHKMPFYLKIRKLLCYVFFIYSVYHGEIVLPVKAGQTQIGRESDNLTTVLEQNNETHDYPNNQRITEEQLQRFQEYYKCLNDSKIRPKAHYIVPGASVRLQCAACLSPHNNSIDWRYSNKATNFTMKFVRDEKSVNTHTNNLQSTLSEDRLTLTLYGVSAADSGHYDCLQDGNVITPHLLQVAQVTEPFTKVKSQGAPRGPYPSAAVTLTDIGVTVWTQWSNWSVCSTCPHAGKRIRIGTCIVSPIINSSAAGEDIFQLFTDGLPCRSSLLPQNIRNRREILSKSSEYIVGFCKERCLPRLKYLLKETAGTLVKKLGQSGSRYTLLNQLPRLPPPMKHTMLYLQQFDTAYIQCPGSDNNDALVHWRLGVTLDLKMSQRIQLTPTHILIIRDLALSDSDVYSCWQRHRLAGLVTLTVYRPVEHSFQEIVNAVVLISIIVSFIVIALKILRATLKRRQLLKTK